MNKDIDWRKAPEWANAVVASTCGTLYFVEKFGGVSERQKVGDSYMDCFEANMEAPHSWTLISTRPSTWNGKGLPPVGTKCMYAMCLNAHPETPGNFYECEVRYVIEDTNYQCGGVVALCYACGGTVEQYLEAETTLFKPLPVKSEADIEKEAAKAAAIAEIVKDFESIWASSDVELAEALYKLGYVKNHKKGG